LAGMRGAGLNTVHLAIQASRHPYEVGTGNTTNSEAEANPARHGQVAKNLKPGPSALKPKGF